MKRRGDLQALVYHLHQYGSLVGSHLVPVAFDEFVDDLHKRLVRFVVEVPFAVP